MKRKTSAMIAPIQGFLIQSLTNKTSAAIAANKSKIRTGNNMNNVGAIAISLLLDRAQVLLLSVFDAAAMLR